MVKPVLRPENGLRFACGLMSLLALMLMFVYNPFNLQTGLNGGDVFNFITMAVCLLTAYFCFRTAKNETAESATARPLLMETILLSSGAVLLIFLSIFFLKVDGARAGFHLAVISVSALSLGLSVWSYLKLRKNIKSSYGLSNNKSRLGGLAPLWAGKKSLDLNRR